MGLFNRNAAEDVTAPYKDEFKAIEGMNDPTERLEAYKTFKEKMDKIGGEDSPMGSILTGGFVGLLISDIVSVPMVLIAGALLGPVAAVLSTIATAAGTAIAARAVVGDAQDTFNQSKFQSFRSAQKVHKLEARAARRIRKLTKNALKQNFEGTAGKSEATTVAPVPATRAAVASTLKS